MSATHVGRFKASIVLLLAAILGGCRTGGLETEQEIITSPSGIRLSIESGDSLLYGELLEVRTSGLAVLLDPVDTNEEGIGQVVLVGPDVLGGDVRGGTDGPAGQEERGRRVRFRLERDREWLRGLSRFPYGMTPEVERQLLGISGQNELILLDSPPGKGSDDSVDPRAEAFTDEVRAATLRFADRELAIRHGYRRVGPDFPGMGEHWVNPGLVLAGGVDPGQPQILTYLEVEGEVRLTGAAFAMPLGTTEEPPDSPVGREAWHDHDGSIDEESLILESPHTVHRDGEGPRLAMFHTWLWPENPAGPLAQNNWALPYARLGLEAPTRPETSVTRALSLVGTGEAYYGMLLARIVGASSHGSEVETRDDTVIKELIGSAAGRVRQVLAADPGASELTSEQAEELHDVWLGLWAELEGRVSSTTWRSLESARLVWGGGTGADGSPD